jgi:phosphoribosylformimino-5-aminoimidazole carboxamide ribotide isomerase
MSSAPSLFRPCIDIHQGKVKQIIGSTLTDSDESVATNFEASKPANYYANLYKQDNLPGGHIIRLGRDDETTRQALSALEAYPGGMHIGGGMNADNCKEWVTAGASHIIFSSFLFTEGQIDMKRIQTLVKEIGKERIVFDLSCRKRDDRYFVVIDRWQTYTELEVTIETLKDLSVFCDEFLVHGVDVEGKKQGIEHDLLSILSQYNESPMTYAGGIKDMKDIETILEVGDRKVCFTVGSALDVFGGEMKYDTVKSIT